MLSPQGRRWLVLSAICVVAAAIGAGIPWGAGLIWFADSISRQRVDVSMSTDAIVVLTGGSERLATGLQLLAENRAKRVFVSGVHPSVDVGQLLRIAGRPLDRALKDRVDAGRTAMDTEGNAAETAAWMHDQGYHSLRLVTGGYHMPRSLLEFRQALPDALVIPHPVFPNHVKHHNWWFRPGTAGLIISEYNKYLLTRVEQWTGDLLSIPRMQGGT